MPKIKEFFSLLKEQGRINNPKFDELIEKLPDFEISTEAHKAFEDSFMTVDRAASHPLVTSQVRALAFKPLNRDFEKVISILGNVDKAAADKLEALTRDPGRPESGPDTYKRMELLSSSLEELFNKVKTTPGGDEELKKELKKAKDTIHDLTEKFSTAEKDYGSKYKTLETDFNQKIDQYKLDSELEKLAGKFTLAEAFEKNRTEVNKIILSKLKGANTLKVGSKDGQSLIEVFDDKGGPRFNGNSPVTINQLLEEEYKPFLKQSNGDSNSSQQSSQSKPQIITTSGNQNPLSGRGESTSVVMKKR
jgi:hypothetical protein